MVWASALINISRLASSFSVVMTTLPDPDTEQTDQIGQAKPATNEPTTHEIRSWNAVKLLEWIQPKLSTPLDPDDAEKFQNAKIDGEVFLEGVGRSVFMEAGLSFGASFKLAELAKQTTGRKSWNSHGRHRTDSRLTTSQEIANKQGL